VGYDALLKLASVPLNTPLRLVGGLGLILLLLASASYACTTNMGDVVWLPCPIGAIVFGFPIIFLIAAGRESGDWPEWLAYALLAVNSWPGPAWRWP
jgi:hypothetical protein